MIKINLLTDRRGKARGSEKNAQILIAGLGAIAVLGVAVYFVVHRPLLAEVQSITEVNNDLEKQNEAIRKQTADLSKMQAEVKAAQEREAAIERLRSARATPAWMLWELSNIMTRDRLPSVTPFMQKRIDNDPNLQFSHSWDPKKVWITEFSEKGGNFKLQGGAQSDSDYVQLALRMKASMFFEDVTMEGASEKLSANQSSYYSFSIEGKVKY
jgi:Tfp pilus assembly protein PilN